MNYSLHKTNLFYKVNLTTINNQFLKLNMYCYQKKQIHINMLINANLE